MKLHGLQRRAGLFAHVIYLCSTASAVATGTSLGSSANFNVFAPTQRLADMVVGQADAFSRQIAHEWLGEDLPTPETPTTIFIELDQQKSFACTLIDPDTGRHLVWLSGSAEAVTGHLLRHEVAHVVLAAKFGNSMPIWANEGIASRYDNARRTQIRQQKLAGFVEIDSWPRLERLFDQPIRQPWQYATAVSVTDYLVEQGGRRKFIDFVADSMKRDLSAALARHYQLASIEQLEAEWRVAVRVAQRKSGQVVPIAAAPATISAGSFR